MKKKKTRNERNRENVKSPHKEMGMNIRSLFHKDKKPKKCNKVMCSRCGYLIVKATAKIVYVCEVCNDDIINEEIFGKDVT